MTTPASSILRGRVGLRQSRGIVTIRQLSPGSTPEPQRSVPGATLPLHPSRAVSWFPEASHSAVIPVQTGIHTGYFMATTALDSGSHPTGLARNDDEQIALTPMKQPCFTPGM
jgi:hypothetical protein